MTAADPRRRIFLAGASGTIGRATARALATRGHEVVCFVRPSAEVDDLGGAEVRRGDVTDPASLDRDGFRGERFDVLVSCLASRTGAPADAWAIDHDAQCHLLEAAREAGVGHVILLSAICVQKPRLAFQHAKLAFERALAVSGIAFTIIRPTAFFKSLSGQVARVRRGKPWLLFGDGALTACKPISDRDLAAYLADCVDDPSRRNAVLAIGGPGPAVTPREQADMLFELLGRPPRFRRIPIGVMDVVIAVLGRLGRMSPRLRDKAELARIGRYYATESMLVWNGARYDAEATPSTGADGLRDHYAKLLTGESEADLGAHALLPK